MIAEEIKNIKSGTSDLRKFGITMAIVLILLGGVFLWREKSYYLYFFILAAVFIVPGLAVPVALKPVHTAWMTISIVLGWIMTRVILGVLFYLVITPTGWLARLFGEHFLDLKIDKGAKSYWIRRKELQSSKSDYEKQF